jgi:hypothetical protein
MGLIATNATGKLNFIPLCYIRVEREIIYMYSLPELTDSKDASYDEQQGMGRTSPFKTFNSGGSRKISWKLTFISYDSESRGRNLKNLRLLESCVYPREDPNNIIPYIPPAILSVKCGDLLCRRDEELNVILTNYSVSFPMDKVWNSEDDGSGVFFPSKLDVTLSFEVVYDSRYLPGADRIITLGV